MAHDCAPISDAFQVVLNAKRVGAPEASRALAAAEVVAALSGHPASDLPEESVAWVVGTKAPNRTLAQQAKIVVRRILTDSELRELWEETKEYQTWKRGPEGLRKRLSLRPRPRRAKAPKRNTKRRMTRYQCWFCADLIAWEDFVLLKVHRSAGSPRPDSFTLEREMYAHEKCLKKTAHRSIGKVLYPELYGEESKERKA